MVFGYSVNLQALSLSSLPNALWKHRPLTLSLSFGGFLLTTANHSGDFIFPCCSRPQGYLDLKLVYVLAWLWGSNPYLRFWRPTFYQLNYRHIWSNTRDLNPYLLLGGQACWPLNTSTAWSLPTVTIRFLESHNLVCFHYTKAGIYVYKAKSFAC